MATMEKDDGWKMTLRENQAAMEGEEILGSSDVQGGNTPKMVTVVPRLMKDVEALME